MSFVARPGRTSLSGVPLDMDKKTGIPAPTISIADAAQALAVSPRTIRRMIARGELPARRIGPRLVRILAADVDDLGRALAVPRR